MPETRPLSMPTSAAVAEPLPSAIAVDVPARHAESDQIIAEVANGRLVDAAQVLTEMHDQAVDPRLRALLDGATDTLLELAATLTEHAAARVSHRF
ncbi:hypothetical protein [Pseudonocardia sp. GCM10023141]|uniref:hypothetical protein n=1 Tax=Pseudonocardia sp. GCM10023141 TaxID=3252653 RepID=UPI00361EE7A1